ncbi:MAG: T9SS type A sorting domain-containing protein [bacterium]|nr:T9SS type A sorting domain-containing protein [bacterium]
MTKPFNRINMTITVLLLLTMVQSAGAAWQQNGYLVESDVEAGSSPTPIADGQGGMIITWDDGRMDDNYHIFAQRIDADGNKMWQDGGVPVCTYPGGTQTYPAVASDGQGGAYFIWKDVTNSGNQHIYGQYITSNGSTNWTTNGILLDNDSPLSVSNTMLTSADDGTAYAGWVENTTGSIRKLKIMRLNASGKMWPSTSSAATVSSGYFDFPLIDCTSLGVTVVFGRYNFTFSLQEVFYSTMGPTGVLAVSPTRVHNDGNDQYSHQFQADPLGGFYVTWQLYGPNGVDQDITLAHVNAGSPNTPSVITVCSYSGTQKTPFLAVVDDGAVVFWEDHRYLEDNIFAQKVSIGLAPQWNTNGRQVCGTSTGKEFRSAVSDGSGGAIICWADFISTNGMFYAQRITSDGYIGWDSDGVAFTAAGNNQDFGSAVSDGDGGIIAVWKDTVSSNNGLMIQRLEKSGYWGYPAPSLNTVEDIPGDQGGKVLVSYDASRLDTGSNGVVAYYSLWRALPESKVAVQATENWLELIQKGDSPEPIIRSGTAGDKTLYWEMVNTQNAYGLDGYSNAVDTHSDHTETNEGLHHFQVMCHAALGGGLWISNIGQGWSVDNLGPSLVAGLVGEAAGPNTYNLSWLANGEPDLHHYVVHRGLNSDFVPGPGNLVAQVYETSLQDNTWDSNSGWFYKVAAVDIHANDGPFAVLESNQLSGGESSNLPGVTLLRGNHPNPFNPQTTIRYELAESGPVRLEIFDASGHLVRVLVDERQAAGHRSVVWNGRDSGNRQLSSGVYLYRMQAGGKAQIRRMTLVK